MEYADGGRGVSIAFNLRAIRPPQEFGYAVTFAPCVYFEVEKKALLEAALSHFINMIARLYRDTGSKQWAAQQLRDWRRVDNIYSLKFDRAAFDAEMQRRFDEKLHTALARTSFDLLRLASHCKNAAFHQECEWRLSLPHSKNKPLTQNKVLYRGVNQNIPYLAHNLFQEKLPITHVLAGPLCQHVTQVEEILAKYAYNAAVTKSTIPIRSANEIR
jgi:hypothetical protein